MHHPSGFYQAARRLLTALLCAGAFLAAGCHNNNYTSGYGIAWVTLSDSPGDFSSYIVNIDSITLTRNDGYVATALATPETVDFTKLSNYSELWGTATVPTGTYVSASIVLDYTNAYITIMVNGLPQQVKIIDANGAVGGTGASLTETVNVILDPANPLVLAPTFSTTSALRLALDFNVAASTPPIDYSTSPPTVQVKPYFTAAIAPPDNKLIRVRGPLINSSVNLGTFTVYVRPFFDEINSLGSLSIFTTPNTIYSTNGVVTSGPPGLLQLSQSSAGTTTTAAFTTYTSTVAPSATAGIYTAKYVVAGSTLEDVYTTGLEGDVVARTGNTLTLRGSTLQINNGSSISDRIYNTADATVLVGPATTVTADDDTSLTGLDYRSIGVGQHIIARGTCEISSACAGSLTPTAGLVFDASSSSSTNTGSVRLIQTNIWGSLVSSTAGNLLLNVQAISDWPISDFAFAGNGQTAASDPTGASFLVNTGAIAIPAIAAGGPVFVDGFVAPFGSAPPDFNAMSVNSELSVQQIGGVAPSTTCGQAVLNCTPASMRVYWTSPGTRAPFLGLGNTGMTVDLGNASFASGTIRVGAESIDMKTLSVSPTIVATLAAAPVTATAPSTGAVPQTLPPVFLPEYSYGVPNAAAPAGISVFSAFGSFANGLATALAATPALQFEARGTFDRATNTFYAISANVVL